MSRVNHVKIVTDDPEAVDRFLREVAELPAGWRLGSASLASAQSQRPRVTEKLTPADVRALRGSDETQGFIVGDEKSRQFQVIRGREPRIWSTAIGTRDVVAAHRRCVERGYAATDVDVTPWSESTQVRFFFAKVAGIVFEVMQVEPRAK